MPRPQQVKQRAALDAALVEFSRKPDDVGVLWQTPIAVRETAQEAHAYREILRTSVTPEGVALFLSYSEGYDFSTLPTRFAPGELRAEIAATNATPNGLVHKLATKLGADTEVTREEFFEQALLIATQYELTVAGTPAQVLDHLKERSRRRTVAAASCSARPLQRWQKSARWLNCW